MAKIEERYEIDSEWRKEPQRSFWKELEQSAPSVWSELDDIARRWAEVAPGGSIEGPTISYYAGVGRTMRMGDVLYQGYAKHGITFVPDGGTLTDTFHAEVRAWQKQHGLDPFWISAHADMFVLMKYTPIMALDSMYMKVLTTPQPTIPVDEIGNTPAEHIRRTKEHYRNVLVPYLGLSQVQTVDSPYHLEWVVLYQCVRTSFADIAKRYAPELNPESPNLDPRSVEAAVKRAADVIQLPLRKLPRGRKARTA